jgi:curved DNA-binding protein CbpA
MTHYDRLEISTKASPEVVRAAYRSLIQRFHPDRRPGDAAAAQCAAEITVAYEVLSDPERRAAYDRDLAASAAEMPSMAPAAGRAGLTQRRASAPSPFATSQALPIAIGGLGALLTVGVIGGAIWLAIPKQVDRQGPDSSRPAIAATGSPQTPAQPPGAQAQASPQPTAPVQAGASADAAADLDGRSIELADAPLVLRLRNAEITIPRLRLVLGSVDAGSLRTHIATHRESLLAELTRSAAGADVAAFMGPAGEAFLRELLQGALTKALGLRPGEALASMPADSPARYGVIDMLLPQAYSVRPD